MSRCIVKARFCLLMVIGVVAASVSACGSSPVHGESSVSVKMETRQSVEAPISTVEVAPGAEVAAHIPEEKPVVPADSKIIILAAQSDDPQQRDILRRKFLSYGGGAIQWKDIDVRDGYRQVLDAYESSPDLLVIVGTGLLGPLDLLSAGFLDISTVTVGGQIAEPTYNVSAVVWAGADGRAALQDEVLPFTNAQRWSDDIAAVTFDIFVRDLPSRVYRLG